MTLIIIAVAVACSALVGAFLHWEHQREKLMTPAQLRAKADRNAVYLQWWLFTWIIAIVALGIIIGLDYFT